MVLQNVVYSVVPVIGLSGEYHTQYNSSTAYEVCPRQIGSLRTKLVSHIRSVRHPPGLCVRNELSAYLGNSILILSRTIVGTLSGELGHYPISENPDLHWQPYSTDFRATSRVATVSRLPTMLTQSLRLDLRGINHRPRAQLKRTSRFIYH